jgi:hypothetical protein
MTYFEILDPLHRYFIALAAGIIIPLAVFVPYVKIKQFLRSPSKNKNK